ncbi:PAS domain S-box protein [Pedobacter sp. PWIIR3]
MKQFDEIKTLLGNSTTYYLIAVDMESNYSYLNRRYAQIFEPIHGDLIGQNYAVTLHPDDQQTCKIVSHLAFTYRESAFPAMIRKNDGHGGYFITKWEYKAMFDEDGSPMGIFCIGHDITDLTQITGELDEMKNTHSHLVRKHVANLVALGKMLSEETDSGEMRTISTMIEQSAVDLDQVIRSLYH